MRASCSQATVPMKQSPAVHVAVLVASREDLEMVTATVRAGVCGFTSVITAASDDMQNVSFTVETDCDTIKKLAAGLPVVDGYTEIGAGFNGALHQAFRSALSGCCSGCAVPVGIFKAMQVAAGLALRSPVSIEIEKA